MNTNDDMRFTNNTGFTNMLFNGDVDRLRRQQIVRFGVIVCLILMLLDSSNRQYTDARAIKTNSKANGIPNSKLLPRDFTYQLNMISKGSSLDGFDELIYPRNLTGMFRGSYSRKTEITRMLDIADNQGPDNISGKLLMQLRSVSIPNVNDLHFVYGVIKLYGAGPRMSDLLLPIQGISLPNFGIVTLLITHFKTQKLFLQLPGGNFTMGEIDKNNSKITNLNSSISIVSINNSINVSTDSRRRLISDINIHNEMNSLDKYMNYKHEKTTNRLIEKSRILTTTNTINKDMISVPVGNTGMILHLVDGTKSNNILTRRNDTNVIGENELPVAFKNLQDIVSATLSQGPNQTLNCPEAVSLNTKPLDIQIKDINEKMLKGDPSLNMLLDGFVGSTGCGMYNITAASFVLPLEILDNKARHYSICAVIVCIFQIGLLVLQSRYSQNQAAASKLSITSICQVALLDATWCIVHFLMCTILPKIFFAYFMWIAILKLVMFCVFEMRTVVMIYQARFSQELSSEGWLGLRRRLASLHLRFYMSLFVMIFLGFIFHSRPKILIMIFYSFWWPQIYHNAFAGTRKPFHLTYLWGTAVLRLFMPLYFIGCPNNFLHILLLDQPLFEASFQSCLFLIFWVILQACILTAQDIYGSRFFVPNRFLPSKYDYFRYVRNGTINDGGIDYDEENGNLCECVICYNGIQYTSGSYMITPCDHVFHKECLSRWLDVKLECPTCRGILPTYDED